MPTRRCMLAWTGSTVIAAQATPVWSSEVYVVSRERILRQVKAALALRRIEEAMTRRLQGQIDQAKQDLAAEEQELSRLRTTASQAVFEARVQEFDRRVRRTRALTQERAAALQKAFQDARAKIVAALPQAEAEVAKTVGARLIVSADHVIFADATVDLTDRVIAVLDRMLPEPEAPDVDLDAPILEPAATDAPDTAPKDAPAATDDKQE